MEKILLFSFHLFLFHHAEANNFLTKVRMDEIFFTSSSSLELTKIAR